MAHKTLTISEEAYEALKKLKVENESFTKTILRLGKKLKKKSLAEFAGKLKDEKFEKASLELREVKEQRLKKVKL